MLKIPGDVGYRTVDQICASNRTFLNQLKFRDTSCQDNLQIRLDQCNVVFLCAENGIKCMINIRFYGESFYYGYFGALFSKISVNRSTRNGEAFK